MALLTHAYDPVAQTRWVGEALRMAQERQMQEAKMRQHQEDQTNAMLQAALQDSRRAIEFDRRMEFDKARDAREFDEKTARHSEVAARDTRNFNERKRQFDTTNSVFVADETPSSAATSSVDLPVPTSAPSAPGNFSASARPEGATGGFEFSASAPPAPTASTPTASASAQVLNPRDPVMVDDGNIAGPLPVRGASSSAELALIPETPATAPKSASSLALAMKEAADAQDKISSGRVSPKMAAVARAQAAGRAQNDFYVRNRAANKLATGDEDSGVFDTLDEAVKKADEYTAVGKASAPVRDPETGKWSVKFSLAQPKPEFDAAEAAQRLGLTPFQAGPNLPVLYKNADNVMFRPTANGFIGATPKTTNPLTTDEQVWTETMAVPTRGMDEAEPILKKAGLTLGATMPAIFAASDAGKITRDEAMTANHWLEKFRTVNGIDPIKDFSGSKTASVLAKERGKLAVISKKGVEVEPVLDEKSLASAKKYSVADGKVTFDTSNFLASVQQALSDRIISEESARQALERAGYMKRAR